MYRYSIELEEIDDPRELKRILEEVGDTYASIHGKGKLTIDTSASMVEICEVLKEWGYEIINVEMIN